MLVGESECFIPRIRANFVFCNFVFFESIVNYTWLPTQCWNYSVPVTTSTGGGSECAGLTKESFVANETDLVAIVEYSPISRFVYSTRILPQARIFAFLPSMSLKCRNQLIETD